MRPFPHRERVLWSWFRVAALSHTGEHVRPLGYCPVLPPDATDAGAEPASAALGQEHDVASPGACFRLAAGGRRTACLAPDGGHTPFGHRKTGAHTFQKPEPERLAPVGKGDDPSHGLHTQFRMAQ